MTQRQNFPLRYPARPAGRAVVIGAGIAGLAAAQVLAGRFAEVLLLDRDWLPAEPAFRAGVPQAQHAHTLLPYGQMILAELFPGLVECLLADGAQAIDDDLDAHYHGSGVWRKPEPKVARPTLSCSRPMLENALYRRVAAHPRVRIFHGVEAAALIASESGGQVAGVAVRDRQAPGGSLRKLSAGLVVDASGRASKTPQWLAGLGYPQPEEWRINAHAGYASRIYQQPEGAGRPAWKKLYISPNPPDGTRGGVILPLEGGRWHVTLIGIAGDYPPTDEAGFMEFARSLPSPALSEAIQAARPLSKVAGFRKCENILRRYENLPRYLEGLLVLGDAAFTMNPVYSLGMTAALAGSQALDSVLQNMRASRGLHGLSAAFQKKQAASLAALWRQAVTYEWRWPTTEISDNSEALYPQVI